MKLLIYPDRPTQKQKLWNIVKMLDIEPVYDHGIYDRAIWYDYRGQFSNSSPRFINGSLRNILKDHVDVIFSTVFGYSTLVNPLTYQGVCVRKGIWQCTKDGRIYHCPIIPEEGYIYQKLIDARISLDRIRVIRVPVFRWGKQEAIPFIWTVEKNVRWTFKDPLFMYAKKLKVCNADDLFTREEIVRILEFSAQMGINWAELDILRDSDGKIYIIDVNNIPGNHAFYMMDYKYVVKYVQTFKEIFL